MQRKGLKYMLFPIELYKKMWSVTIWETSSTKKALNRIRINNHHQILNPPNRFLNLNLCLYLTPEPVNPVHPVQIHPFSDNDTYQANQTHESMADG